MPRGKEIAPFVKYIARTTLLAVTLATSTGCSITIEGSSPPPNSPKINIDGPEKPNAVAIGKGRQFLPDTPGLEIPYGDDPVYQTFYFGPSNSIVFVNFNKSPYISPQELNEIIREVDNLSSSQIEPIQYGNTEISFQKRDNLPTRYLLFVPEDFQEPVLDGEAVKWDGIQGMTFYNKNSNVSIIRNFSNPQDSPMQEVGSSQMRGDAVIFFTEMCQATFYAKNIDALSTVPAQELACGSFGFAMFMRYAGYSYQDYLNQTLNMYFTIFNNKYQPLIMPENVYDQLSS